MSVGPAAPPSGPAEYGPEPERLRTGDPHDDDGQVFDRLLTDTSNAPEVVPSTPPAPVYPAPDQRPATTRLLSGNGLAANTTDVVQALPADPRRKALMIRCVSLQAAPATGDLVNWSDDLTKVQPPSTGSIPPLAAQVFDRDGWVTIVDHTGPLFYCGSGTANASRFEWCAVTV